MPGAPATAPENLRGAAWLVADMSLNIWALSIVKAMGADYPAAQIVFLRVLVGLAVIAPWVWQDRSHFSGLANLRLHLLRVALSSITLVASFFAIARVPFATFTAVNFVRPVLLMILAALLMGERISSRRWLAATLAFGGALLAVGPGSVTQVITEQSLGTASLCLAVTTGTFAVILTRRLKGVSEVVMMLFYTGGIAAVMAPLAWLSWVPVAPADWPLLLAVGVFAQAAQLCFLRAHWLGDAGVLASVSYLAIILSTAAGYFLFAEVPEWHLLAGAAMIVLANMAVVSIRSAGKS